MSNINRFMSPRVTRREDTSFQMNDMIRVINEMNQIIKVFYKKMKTIVHNNDANSNNVRVVFDNIDTVMKMFVLDVKKCFANLKQLTTPSIMSSPIRNDIRGVSTPKMVSHIRTMSPQQHQRNSNNNNSNNSNMNNVNDIFTLEATRRILNIVKEYKSNSLSYDNNKLIYDKMIKELPDLLSCILISNTNTITNSNNTIDSDNNNNSNNSNSNSLNIKPKIKVNTKLTKPTIPSSPSSAPTNQVSSYITKIKTLERELQFKEQLLQQSHDDIKLKNDTISKLNYTIHHLKTSTPSKTQITPLTHIILSDKTYKHLHFYLLTTKPLNPHSTLKYSDCIWLPSTEIDKHLHSYNKFQTEKQSELDLHKVFLRKLEQKEEEISKLKHKYESMKNTNTNRTTEVNSNIVHNKLMDLNLTTKDNDNNNNNNAIPLHKYQDVINELNKTYKKYNETLHVIGKMQNDNKVIPKSKEDESAFMDKDELLDIPDCSTVQLLQIKSLLQLLVMEFTLNIKSKKILTDLLMIVGYSQKEIEKLMEGNKKIKRK